MRQHMKWTRQYIGLACGLALLILCSSAQWSSAQFSTPVVDIPAHHDGPPPATPKQPPLLSGKQLTGPSFVYPWQVKVYKAAARIPNVLYQLPCYCRCDRALGHQSLRSCFEGTHGAECSTCAQEGFYAYQMTRKGWTPQQIREGVERGDYKKIDLKQAAAQTAL